MKKEEKRRYTLKSPDGTVWNDQYLTEKEAEDGNAAQEDWGQPERWYPA